MQSITFFQLLAQAAVMGADVTQRGDGIPAFMVEQYDAQPEEERALVNTDNNAVVTYGDKTCGLLMGSLNLNGADTEAFFLAAAPAIIPSITKRQFLIAAADSNMITWEEAKSGAVPAAIQAVFDTLPPLQQNAAEVTWATMTRIERDEVLVSVVAAAFGMTGEQIDAFFIQAAAI